MGSHHPPSNVKTLCVFELQIWPEIITSRDAETTCFKVVTGKSLDSSEKQKKRQNVEKCQEISQKCPKIVQSPCEDQCEDNFFLDISCLFGQCFYLVTLSNACPLQF